MYKPESAPPNKPEFKNLLSLVHQLMPEDAKLLAYDEDQGGTSEEVRAAAVGLIWEIDNSNLQDGESAKLCVCDEDGRYRLGALLNKVHGIETLPLAFIELSIVRPDASFSSMSYILESGEVRALVDTSIIDDTVLLDDSEDCFDFADNLGLGGEWTKAMFQAIQPGRNTISEVIKLNPHQIERLYSFLNPEDNRV